MPPSTGGLGVLSMAWVAAEAVMPLGWRGRDHDLSARTGGAGHLVIVFVNRLQAGESVLVLLRGIVSL